MAQPQAVLSRIVVVRSVPLTVRRAFESAANKQGVQSGCPSCYYSDAHASVWVAAGDVTRVQGHFCLLPLRIEHQGTPLRANDPLSCNGDLSRKGAIKSLKQLADVLGVAPLFAYQLSLLLLRNEFTEGGELRCRVRAIVSDLSYVAVVRIVDRGPGQLWGFCRQWAWDELQNFLLQQGYTQESRDMPTVLSDLHASISANKFMPKG